MISHAALVVCFINSNRLQDPEPRQLLRSRGSVSSNRKGLMGSLYQVLVSLPKFEA
jgi:hypothetical protein